MDDSAGSSHVRPRGALSLLFLYVILAAAGCNYVDERVDSRRAAAKRTGDERRPGPARARDGISHSVKKGENLFRIGKAYGVDHKTLARINHISDARDIKVGRRLFIPGADRLLPVAIITPIKKFVPAKTKPARAKAPAPRTTPRAEPARPSTARAKTAPAKAPGAKTSRPKAQARKSAPAKTRAARPPSRGSRHLFAWPLKGRITGKFNSRPDSLNDGINIAAPPGTPVHATLAGQVIYSDQLRGYGNLIILRHRGGFASVYAHNRKNLVRQGQKVNRRQVIAEVGATGRAATPYLHFEIRRHNVARNPLSYLP
ncbi:MAG: M23 family metallopeptidase [Deltaproteobacteria bacterium]|nr:M23 family metallopeptidase [Deltaproteobacteria bacterium]